MTDLISRQEVIDTLKKTAGVGNRILDVVRTAPSVNSVSTPCQQDVNGDVIDRQAVINKFEPWLKVEGYSEGEINMLKAVLYELTIMPSAEPEVIRCKDCKYQDENWRRVSVRWLPCMDMRTGSNWYCGSAERRTNE